MSVALPIVFAHAKRTGFGAYRSRGKNGKKRLWKTINFGVLKQHSKVCTEIVFASTIATLQNSFTRQG